MPVGDIVHIEGLYIKPQTVKANVNIVKGDYLIDDSGLRPVVAGDFSADDRFFNIGAEALFQAGHDANNLTTTPVNDRVTEVSVLTPGSDWVCTMAANVKPENKVGLTRLDSRVPVIAISDVANSLEPTIVEILGHYKHKEFAKLASDSALNDDGVIATGLI